MKANKTLSIILGGAALFVVLIIILAVRDGGEITSTGSGERTALAQEVPDLTLKDYDGNDVRLRDIKGDIVLLNAWATWCPFCVDEIPDFVQAQNEFEGQLTVVLINRQESFNQAKKFTDDLGATGNVITLLDPSDSFYRKIGGFAMPETLFVKDNSIVLHKRGPMTLQEVKLRVKTALEPT